MNDKELVDRLKAGDEEAFNILYCTHRKWVFSRAYRAIRDYHYAEEITTDVFMNIWRRIHTFDFQNGRGFLSWVNTVVRNAIIDFIRVQDRKRLDSLEWIDDLESPIKILEPCDPSQNPSRCLLYTSPSPRDS